jgi:hypothetical protein
MQHRIVKITNTYDGTEKWGIQWRVPLFGWWWFCQDAYYGGKLTWDSYKSCEETLMSWEKSDAKEIIKVIKE